MVQITIGWPHVLGLMLAQIAITGLVLVYAPYPWLHERVEVRKSLLQAMAASTETMRWVREHCDPGDDG